MLTLGLGLLLAALSVHFRDIRDLLGNVLTLWFFATPIIYPYTQAPERCARSWTSTRSRTWPLPTRKCCTARVRYRQGARLLDRGGVSLVALIVGYAVFDRLRETFAEEV